MLNYLIYLGLVLSPFAFWRGIDIRSAKEVTAFGVALAIGLVAIHSGKLKKFNNVWIPLLLGFHLFSMLYSPSYPFFMAHVDSQKHVDILIGTNLSGLWSFKPFLYGMVYFLMVVAIASQRVSKDDLRVFLQIMVWCGLIMSFYVFLQYFGLDQYYDIVPEKLNPDVPHMTNPHLGGYLGQPTVMAPLLVMLIPLAVYLKRWGAVTCLIVAAVLIRSDMALIAGSFGMTAYLLIRKERVARVIGVFIVISALVVGGFYFKAHTKEDIKSQVIGQLSGRAEGWQGIWNDIRDKVPSTGHRYTWTGKGPGSFYYVHPVIHDNKWKQAHCEPLEVLYNLGFLGLFLFIMALKVTFTRVYEAYWRMEHEDILAVAGSFFIILLCSLGSFPFQIGTTAFYSAFLVGILHNDNLMGGRYHEG